MLKTSDMKDGEYYLIQNPGGIDKCLVYCYANPDFENGTTLGIGFNVADGASWIPLSDISDSTEIFKATITSEHYRQ